MLFKIVKLKKFNSLKPKQNPSQKPNNQIKYKVNSFYNKKYNKKNNKIMIKNLKLYLYMK